MRLDVEPLQLLAQLRHVAGHLRADVRVQAHGGEALVLAVLRQHLRRDGEERLGKLFTDDLGHPRLVLRIDEREQEADGDSFDAGVLERTHLGASLLLVQRHEHGTVLDDSLGHRQPIAPPHDRVALPRQILVVREVERLLVPCDVEDVAVALGREHPHPRAGVLDHDVGGDRRPVEDLVQLRRRRLGLRGDVADTLNRPLGGIGRRGRQLVDEDPAGLVVDVDEIGERAADVYSEPLHGVRTIFPKCSRRSIMAIASRASDSGNTLCTSGVIAPRSASAMQRSTSSRL